MALQSQSHKTEFKQYVFSKPIRKLLNWGIATCLAFVFLFGVLTHTHLSSNSAEVIVFIGFIIGFLLIGYFLFWLNQLVYCSYQIDQEKITAVVSDRIQYSITWDNLDEVSFWVPPQILILVSKTTRQTILIDSQIDYFEELKQIILDRTGHTLSTIDSQKGKSGLEDNLIP
ncbi:MAG: hypothetical protein HY774_04985 [Acidobacteria bacterium]|nr:hypothetical protein [Acidobacteriota bacterium]